MLTTILLVAALFAVEATNKIVYSTKQAHSIDWNSVPHDNEEVFHSLNLHQVDGSVTVVQHKRSILSCGQEQYQDGFLPRQNVLHYGRKLKQVADDEVLGNVVDQAILGSDDRFHVQDTRLFPFSAVGLLVFEAVSSGRLSFCTGTMISNIALITSGHCIWDRANKAFNSKFQFYPARNGNIKPYGWIQWSNIAIPADWEKNGTQQFDYAIIRLVEPVGNQTGYLGFGFECGYGKNSVDDIYGLMGYPLDQSNELWMDKCNIEAFDPCNNNVSHPQVVNHQCDTLGGQSGSVLWKIVNQRAQIRAIHQGYTFANVDYNNAIAITKQVFDFIIRNMRPSN